MGQSGSQGEGVNSGKSGFVGEKPQRKADGRYMGYRSENIETHTLEGVIAGKEQDR